MRNLKNSSKFKVFLYLHPHFAIGLLLLILNFVLVGVFSIVFFALGNGNISYSTCLEYCFTLTMSSDGIYTVKDMFQDNYGIAYTCHVIMISVQMILFSGALIGFVTSILSDFFDNSLNNRGKISLKNHVVLLNWNSIGANIVYDLSFEEEKETVVILSNTPREEILNSINSVFIENHRKNKNIKILVKTGDSFSLENLQSISIQNAKTIGVLLEKTSENSTDNGYEQGELKSLRLLLSILHLIKNINVVVEVSKKETAQKIEQLVASISPENKDYISTFCYQTVIGHILGKTAISKDFAKFYYEVLSYDGVEFYAVPTQSIDEFLSLSKDSIPIINYDDDLRIGEDGEKSPDHLYVLDEDGKIEIKRKEKLIFDRKLPYKETKSNEGLTIFIIGENFSLPYVLEEFNEHKEKLMPNLNWKHYTNLNDIETIVKDANECNGKVRLLLLSDNNSDSDDKNLFTFFLNLKVNHHLREDIEIYAEIENPSNYQAVKNIGIVGSIITNKLSSLFMIQLLTHPNSKRFFQDILTNKGDIDIDIIDAKYLFDFSEEKELIFTSKAELVNCFYNSSNKKRMILGYRNKNEENISYLCTNMDDYQKITITEDTAIVSVIY